MTSNENVPVEKPGATQLPVIGIREGAFGVGGTGDTSGFGGLRTPVAMPGPTQGPYGNWFDDVLARLNRWSEDAIVEVIVDRGELTIVVAREKLVGVARTLRDDNGLRFEFCSSLSGVHFPGDAGRELHVAIHLLSMTYRRRVRIVVTCPDDDRHVPSLTSIYPTTDWHERETWDMFGIIFDGHPGLTRILMPDDWDGHPQRKDYPLGGIPVEYKGGTIPPPNERRSYA